MAIIIWKCDLISGHTLETGGIQASQGRSLQANLAPWLFSYVTVLLQMLRTQTLLHHQRAIQKSSSEASPLPGPYKASSTMTLRLLKIYARLF